MPKTVELGSQIFINNDDDPGTIERWVTQLARSGLRIIRVFLFWDHVEPEAGVWSFTNYDACFKQAEALGVLMVPTLMAVSPPGWMRVTSGPQDIADLDDPELWAAALAYVRRVVGRYHLSPALHSWILWNEPTRRIPRTPYAMEAFASFLRERYGRDITELNRRYFRSYRDFTDIIAEEEPRGAPDFGGYTERLDWARFSVHDLCTKLRDIGSAVRSIDPTHPIHVNPHALANNRLYGGQSIWEEAEVVDFLGCSAHPAWHSTKFLPARVNHSIAFFADLMRSATRHEHGEFWVTELQGGVTTFSGNQFLGPTRNDIRHWVWESIGSGASAVVFWCFNSRNSGSEAGEWALVNQRGLPSDRLAAATEIAGLLERHRDLFATSRPRRPDVWLLYSEPSWMLGEIEGRGDDRFDPRNREMAADALCGAYLMCADLGLDIGFINEDRLTSGALPGDAILIAPGATALHHRTCLSLSRFIEGGGKLIADGLCGMKDPDGRVAVEGSILLAEALGCMVDDIQSRADPITVMSTGGEALLNGWFFQCQLHAAPETGVLGRFEDGSVAVTCNVKGTAIRIGTVFFQRYLTRTDEKNLRFLASLLPENSKLPRLLNPSPELRLKVLKGEGRSVLVLLNNGEAKTAFLAVPNESRLSCLENDGAVVIDGAVARIPLDMQEIRVLLMCT
jgi:beta-galactosidase